MIKQGLHDERLTRSCSCNSVLKRLFRVESSGLLKHNYKFRAYVYVWSSHIIAGRRGGSVGNLETFSPFFPKLTHEVGMLKVIYQSSKT